jgi:hypothetical protein
LDERTAVASHAIGGCGKVVDEEVSRCRLLAEARSGSLSSR